APSPWFPGWGAAYPWHWRPYDYSLGLTYYQLYEYRWPAVYRTLDYRAPISGGYQAIPYVRVVGPWASLVGSRESFGSCRPRPHGWTWQRLSSPSSLGLLLHDEVLPGAEEVVLGQVQVAEDLVRLR